MSIAKPRFGIAVPSSNDDVGVATPMARRAVRRASRSRRGRAVEKTFSTAADLAAMRPGQIVIVEHLRIPMQTIPIDLAGTRMTDEQRKTYGRLSMSVAFDVATRVILGMTISATPSTSSALATLRMAMTETGEPLKAIDAVPTPNLVVRPEVVMTDAGSTFASDRMRAALAALRIEHRMDLPSQPAMKTMIERHFRSRINGPSSPTGAVEARDDNSEVQEALTRDERYRAFAACATETYNNAPQAALGGETPAARFRRLSETHPLRTSPSPLEMRLAFGSDVRRRPDPRGVRVLGLLYQSSALQEYRRAHDGRLVTVRVDDMNIGEVSVLLDRRWVSLRCTTPGLDGVSAREWIATVAAVRRQHVQTMREQAEKFALLLRDAIPAG